ncbi:MAG: hypothetical protein IPJ75_03245 [Ignavibacteriales bacterium]|nr:hypothetical protein [Ignavibacteriales bacterium]
MNNEGKILVIQTAFPGDSVLSLPFIQELKKRYASREIDVVSTPVSASVFNSSPSVSKVFPFQKRGEHRGIRGMLKFATLLRAKNYSYIYSLHRSARTALLVNLIYSEYSIGFSNSSLKFIYDKLVDYKYDEHEVKRSLRFLGEYPGEEWKIFPEIKATQEEKNRVSRFKEETGLDGDYVILAPGSVWGTKRYPIKYFAEVAASLISKRLKVVVTGSENERGLGEEIVGIEGKEVINSCGQFSIVETVELMRGAKLVITNDSAPTHFAMAADVSVLTIYCSTVPEFGFYGYSPKSYYISKAVSCKPCGIHGHKKCPNGSFECGTSIYPFEVLKKVEEILHVG